MNETFIILESLGYTMQCAYTSVIINPPRFLNPFLCCTRPRMNRNIWWFPRTAGLHPLVLAQCLVIAFSLHMNYANSNGWWIFWKKIWANKQMNDLVPASEFEIVAGPATGIRAVYCLYCWSVEVPVTHSICYSLQINSRTKTMSWQKMHHKSERKLRRRHH